MYMYTCIFFKDIDIDIHIDLNLDIDIDINIYIYTHSPEQERILDTLNCIFFNSTTSRRRGREFAPVQVGVCRYECLYLNLTHCELSAH